MLGLIQLAIPFRSVQGVMAQSWSSSFHFLSWLMVLAGVASSVLIVIDMRARQPQPMAVMRRLGTYFSTGRVVWLLEDWPDVDNIRVGFSAAPTKMGGMDMAPRAFWQSIVAGTLHCGAGCSLADLIDPVRAPPRLLSPPAWCLASGRSTTSSPC